jgi:hypothetical protein
VEQPLSVSTETITPVGQGPDPAALETELYRMAGVGGCLLICPVETSCGALCVSVHMCVYMCMSVGVHACVYMCGPVGVFVCLYACLYLFLEWR